MKAKEKELVMQKMQSLFLLFLLSLPLTLSQTTDFLLPSDAASLLSFKSKADLHNLLYYTLTERFDFCQWLGVKCAQGRVVRYVLHDIPLHGIFPPNTLTSLSHLRVLSLRNTSLSGPLPDLSPLTNLATFSFAHNNFSGTFPLSLLSLHRLTLLDLSFNSFNGPIPAQLSLLNRLNSLKLEYNYFNGTVPPLNQTFLVIFNVSGNNLSGAIPITPTLSRFNMSSFSLNSPELCGEIINKACKSLRSPFFVPTAPLGQSAQVQGGVVVLSPPSKTVPRQLKRTNLIVGFTVGVSVLVFSLLTFLFVMLKKQSQNIRETEEPVKEREAAESNAETPSHSQQKVVNVGVKKGKSGNLVHFGSESGNVYGLEELMRASAELLGRGSVGTTYKAVVDNKLIVTVKRVDASKSAITSSEAFERHMDVVGQLKHPNLVPIMAYFQARGERLVIFEYQPNGSLFNLIHGSRSSRAKPLHWTSCLKIAEDVAQGLAYIHQSSKLVHGNLKSSNVLLGQDFEARITDYCLAVLADTSSSEDPDSAACKAPETRKFIRHVTTKSDVYAFGVLLLELLTGKHPSQHPYLMPADMLDWVRAMREDDAADYNQLGMLTEIANVCSLTSPEQRPAMWQVLKMIQEVKERIMVEEDAAPGYS